MSTPSRSELIARTFRILKKKFKRRPTPTGRTVLEHLLYACCLENATPAQADEAFGKLQTLYFDWNEVRVTTISELTEVMGKISDAPEAARRLRYCLHHVFESHYSFEIDDLKKLTIGKAVKQLKSYQGITPFVISYVVQKGLEGHGHATMGDNQQDQGHYQGIAVHVLQPLGQVAQDHPHAAAGRGHSGGGSADPKDEP